MAWGVGSDKQDWVAEVGFRHAKSSNFRFTNYRPKIVEKQTNKFCPHLSTEHWHHMGVISRCEILKSAGRCLTNDKWAF